MNHQLTTSIAQFLAHKRALGRKYDSEEATLQLLLNFADQHGLRHLHELTPHLLQEFIKSRHRPRARSFNHLIGVIGHYLDWAVGQQQLETSPMQIPRRRDTGQLLPFLVTQQQARQLLTAAAALADNPKAHDRGTIYHAVFALCYGLGLRSGEACNLLVGDIDRDQQLLVVRGGKFGKTRLVPHGPRIGEILAQQLHRLQAHGITAPEAPVFSFDGSRSIHRDSAGRVFTQLMGELNFPVPEGVRSPHLHCLRHSFAVNCLLRWYRQGINPSQRLFRLATFLGHVDPASTAIYLTITPELLTEANQRFEAFAQRIWTEEKS